MVVPDSEDFALGQRPAVEERLLQWTRILGDYCHDRWL